MKEQKLSRASLLLLELSAAVVLFVVCAAVCIGIMLQADAISRESAALTEAVSVATEYAERWRALPYADLSEDCRGLRVVVQNTMRGGTRTASISVREERQEIYRLLVAEVKYETK